MTQCFLCNWSSRGNVIVKSTSFIAVTLRDPFVDHHSCWVPFRHMSPSTFLASEVFSLLRDYLIEYIRQEGFPFFAIRLEFSTESLEGTHAFIHLLGNRRSPLPPDMIPLQELSMFLPRS